MAEDIIKYCIVSFCYKNVGIVLAILLILKKLNNTE